MSIYGYVSLKCQKRALEEEPTSSHRRLDVSKIGSTDSGGGSALFSDTNATSIQEA
jgi:hypothetical protein